MSGANPFWDFSVAFYGRPGIAQACLSLQDEQGVDVNVLLFCVWLGMVGRELDAADVAAIRAGVEEWRSCVVVPLRGVRRSLKAPPASFEPQQVEALRGRVKQIELEAERLQQDALYRGWPARQLGRPATADAPRRNVLAYACALETTFPEPALTQILSGLDDAADLVAR